MPTGKIKMLNETAVAPLPTHSWVNVCDMRESRDFVST